MLSLTASLDLYEKLTNNSETANRTLGGTFLNEGIRMMLGSISWPFLEATTTISTVDGTQSYTLPADLGKIVNVTVTVGTYRYTPRQIFSQDEWDMLNSPTGVEQDNTSYFYVFAGVLYLWPTPGTNGNTITVNYLKNVRDLVDEDYTTGTITSISNGATTVEGSSTSWTAGMADKYIRITSGNAAGLGDGIWYPISSITDSDTLELGKNYQGTTLAAATAGYTIGDVMIIPENYQLGPVYYAASEYWRMNGDAGRADRFEDKYLKLMEQMRDDEGKKTTDPSIDEGYGSPSVINPNLNPTVS